MTFKKESKKNWNNIHNGYFKKVECFERRYININAYGQKSSSNSQQVGGKKKKIIKEGLIYFVFS